METSTDNGHIEEWHQGNVFEMDFRHSCLSDRNLCGPNWIFVRHEVLCQRMEAFLAKVTPSILL